MLFPPFELHLGFTKGLIYQRCAIKIITSFLSHEKTIHRYIIDCGLISCIDEFLFMSYVSDILTSKGESTLTCSLFVSFTEIFLTGGV